MSAEVVERILRSSRYRDVDRSLLARMADEELARSRNVDDAVKRVKRRLHQAVGAFRDARTTPAIAEAWSGDLADPALRAACSEAMRTHASTRERLAHLDAFYPRIWQHTGVPRHLIDLGCGLNPLALPWMGIGDATYRAIDADQRPLAAVRGFLALVGQPHRVEARDLIGPPPDEAADVALLLKLVTTLDRQDGEAAARLLRGLRVGHAVVSFPGRSLAGRGKGMERTYRERLGRLVDDVGRVNELTETSVPNELVFVLRLEPIGG